MIFSDIFRKITNLFKKKDGGKKDVKKKDYFIRTVEFRFSDIPRSMYLVIKKYGWIAFFQKSAVILKKYPYRKKFTYCKGKTKGFLQKNVGKISGLFKATYATYKKEGLANTIVRSLNYIRYGKGILKKKIIEKKIVNKFEESTLLNLKKINESYKPKVSVIVPNYNHEKYLKQRLDSIYSQTYDNLEVILLDDCSTDGSRNILLEFAEKYKDKTKYICNEKNSGSVFSQWERGINNARGDLVWIAESDDYCTKNFISSLVSYFFDESVMLAYCRTDFVSEEEKVWDIESYLEDIDKEKWKSNFVNTAHQIVNYAMAKKNIIPNVSSAIFRHPGSMYFTDKEKWKSLRFCGDWVFYLHVMRGGAIAYTTKATNYYRQHDKNTSTRLHADDIYYTEHEFVAMTIAELYAVSPKIFINQQKMLHDYWKLRRKDFSEEAFNKCYNVKKIIGYQKRRKPNIAMFGFSFAAGGGETFPIILSNSLYNHGYGVTFLDCNQDEREPGVRRMLNTSIPVIKLVDQSTLPIFMKAYGVEIMHSHHGWVDFMISSLTNQLTKCRQVVTMHGMYEMQDDETLKRSLPILCKKVDQWVYTTNKNLDAFKKFEFYNSDKFIKIGNALSFSDTSPISRNALDISDDAFVLCIVSRAIPEKGWEEAIRCVNQARSQSGKDIQLIVIGDGEERRRLESSSPDFVLFLGFKKNIRDYYAMSDMGFIPSRFKGESFPLVIIDCLFSGKPVLSSNIGEVKEMLKTGNSSYAGAIFDLVDWKIPEAELSSLIVRCATDSEFYERMLAEVDNAAKKFNIESVFQKYASCYEKLFKQ